MDDVGGQVLGPDARSEFSELRAYGECSSHRST
jgi:hypothetical protein